MSPADSRQRGLAVDAIGEHTWTFSAQLESRQERTSQILATVRAASAESREQLKQRVDQAQIDVGLAIQNAK